MFKRYIKDTAVTIISVSVSLMYYLQYKKTIFAVLIFVFVAFYVINSVLSFYLEEKTYKEIENEYKDGKISEEIFLKFESILHKEYSKKVKGE